MRKQAYLLNRAYNKHALRLIICELGITSDLIAMQYLLKVVFFDRIRDTIATVEENLDVLIDILHCD